MKHKKRWIAALLAMTFVIINAGCAQIPSQAPSSEPCPESLPATISSSGHCPSSSLDEASDETYRFTDSCGREVEIPKNIERIAPSGPLAQIVLYTLCPDKMVGWSTQFSERQQEYIGIKYASLPVFGNLYGGTLNLEAIMAAKPQIIFDIGEAKNTVKERMDDIQAKTGIPAVFVHMELDSMVAAYKTLGKITGETEQAKRIADYIEQTLAEGKGKADSIPEADRLKVYYGGNNGLTAFVKGTIHADVIDFVGGVNVADVEKTISGGLNEISMEQLMLWDPDVILFAPGSIYDPVVKRPEWQELEAVKNNKIYEVPDGPYNWMGSPPSVNRILGIKWLGNLLYPNVFTYDMVAETQEFYRLFYHCDITQAQVKGLLSRSTYPDVGNSQQQGVQV